MCVGCDQLRQVCERSLVVSLSTRRMVGCVYIAIRIRGNDPDQNTDAAPTVRSMKRLHRQSALSLPVVYFGQIPFNGVP